MKVWPGIPLVWTVTLVRAHSFLGVWRCFRVRGDLGKGRAWLIRVGGEEWVL